jgi:bacillithiol biosynthesis cysteine-adding enzyme BshC
MDCNISTLPYEKTGYFSSIVTDYLKQAEPLRPFYQHLPTVKGFKDAMEARKGIVNHRQLLSSELEMQYAGISTSQKVRDNIQLLLKENTFTVTTAHQPAIFTGTLYFIYKIIHTIKVSEFLKQQFPESDFIPVFYMGSEDADLDELGKIYLNAEKIVWDTKQTGAVGRMNTKGLEKIIARVEGEMAVLPFGHQLVQLLKEVYLNSPDIQTATLKLIDTLFAEHGLVVLIPDNPNLKRVMVDVFKDDLFKQLPSTIVGKTIEQLSGHYKVQATPRQINLFYLKDDIRERIEQQGDTWKVVGQPIVFTKAELLKELEEFPDRFSPNVILRGLFQETILPNIAFIGGGGELAYWLELKNLFAHYRVPYPSIILRNSFLIVERKWKARIAKLGFRTTDFFKPKQELLTALVNRHKNGELKLVQELTEMEHLYRQLKDKAIHIDKSLEQHIEALQARSIKPLQELEKKMLRAEKRKYVDEERQIHSIKTALFPFDGLQERIENFMPYYAKWGIDFIGQLYKYSFTTEQLFVLLEEN